MSNIAYLAGVLKGDGYLYRGQTGRPRFQVDLLGIAGRGRVQQVPSHIWWKGMRLQVNVHCLIREWNRSLGNARNIFHHFIWRI